MESSDFGGPLPPVSVKAELLASNLTSIATSLSDGPVEIQRRALEELHWLTADSDAHIADVGLSVLRFAKVRRFTREKQLPNAVLHSRDLLIPIDIVAMVSTLPLLQRSLFAARRRTRKSLLRRALVRLGRYELVDGPFIANAFASSLARFLTIRFNSTETRLFSSTGGADARASTADIPPLEDGLPFTVTTLSGGLRVHYSPAYFFSPELVFGEPSTPVVGRLHPGLYMFGASKHGKPPEFATDAHYMVPPKKTAHLYMFDDEAT